MGDVIHSATLAQQAQAPVSRWHRLKALQFKNSALLDGIQVGLERPLVLVQLAVHGRRSIIRLLGRVPGLQAPIMCNLRLRLLLIHIQHSRAAAAAATSGMHCIPIIHFQLN